MKYCSLSSEHQNFFLRVFLFDHPIFQATDVGTAHIFVSAALNVRGLDRHIEDVT